MRERVCLSKPSSISESQSLSFWSQISVPGGSGSHDCGAPLMQLVTVRRHSPLPHVVSPRFSSVIPLQSSSRPLHDSVVGTGAVHAS